MYQQVNLYQPILGAERRLFSARAIAVALTVLAVCLVGLGAYGTLHTRRIEYSIDLLARRETANIALAERASLAGRPSQSLEQLDAEAQDLSADIEARRRTLEVVRRGGGTAATGFAARLEALARPQIDGIWLSSVIVGSGEGRLALRGGTTDPRLVPAYLSALAEEPALAGVRFDRLAMRRAPAAELPAEVIFELDGPGLTLPVPEHPR
jgi:hypothetical protein